MNNRDMNLCAECGMPRGVHRWMCNRRQTERMIFLSANPVGWLCPVCGTVNSPATDRCRCRDKGDEL